MNREQYNTIEKYMLECMNDSAHDKEHVYRVLYSALDIASQEKEVDMEVLIIACLLHDIGREEQFQNPTLCHAQVGSLKAYHYLINRGYPEKTAAHIRECILTHRFRSDNPPSTLEAKILFDADKIDVTGTLGIARTLVYKGQVSDPLYSVDQDGNVLDGTADHSPSFFQEYKFKLEGLYNKFYTARGSELAKERRQSAIHFYQDMLREVRECYVNGKSQLSAALEPCFHKNKVPLDYSGILGSRVTGTIDRPIGSTHPRHLQGMVYPINYGYVDGVMAADGDEQDIYLLGVRQPVSTFEGIVIAVIHRMNDNEDKWVVAPEGMDFTDEEILQQVQFQEKFFDIELYR